MNKFNFTFIDLFAGIGGFHLAMHKLGGKCVFASEMDKYARKTYYHNFAKICPEIFENDLYNDDIRKVSPHEIPNFDILCAGFPCQPFSQAGYKRGFNDNHHSERGNLFFNIADIIKQKRPKAFFLENVRGIVKHDKGKTFKIIRDILETELGYSFYYKIIKASDYGLPQLRPRTFMIGFRDENILKGFTFPPKIPLKFNMSDVWEGKCSREIGFTLRVGGRGSKITDRRNWDSYLVDGQVKQLTSKEGKKMQGFPDSFEFPVSKTQAIKQLGNSVAIDAVQAVALQMLRYLSFIDNKQSSKLKKTKNKGEWSELFVLINLLADQELALYNADLTKSARSFLIKKVSNKNLDLDFVLLNKSSIQVVNKETSASRKINLANLLDSNTIEELLIAIKEGKRTFRIPKFEKIQSHLGFDKIKGGTSYQKSDIVLDVVSSFFKNKNEGFGIKSFLGSKPTLLNASGNTNFIFEIKDLKNVSIDEVNAIKTRTKIKDRLSLIEEKGGKFIYKGAEKEAMNYNLKLVDSAMPKLVGALLIAFYKYRISSINEIVDFIHQNNLISFEYSDKKSLIHMIKKLLVDILLGFFAGTKWDGEYKANGTIVVKKSGDYGGFHLIALKELKNYLFHNIKLDTPSSTRHRFGKIYKEKNGRLFFKLNLQLRFK